MSLLYFSIVMAKFVKKSGNTKYYEIDSIRAAGIMPYMIKENKVYILINVEERNKKIVYNSIGGKVDKFDRTVYETMVREFNEETGFLVFDKMRNYFKHIKQNNCIKVAKSKYLLHVLKVSKEDTNIWSLLPRTYDVIFKGAEKFNHRESIQLKWIDLFNFDSNKNTSFLLKVLLAKVRRLNQFASYNPEDPIELDD
jgi:8-oxo-dGTP pyrophosphatase MutT (NUDIX family)